MGAGLGGLHPQKCALGADHASTHGFFPFLGFAAERAEGSIATLSPEASPTYEAPYLYVAANEDFSLPFPECRRYPRVFKIRRVCDQIDYFGELRRLLALSWLLRRWNLH